MEYRDYYKILGVERNADEKTIKQAYRRLARKYHPDVNKQKGAQERIKEINEAYAVLSDPEKRKRYDSLGQDWQRYAERGGAPSGGPFGGGVRVDFGNLGGFSDFFRTFFADLGVQSDQFTDLGAGFGRPGRARGHDLEAQVDVSFEESYHGTRRTVMTHDGRQLDIKIPAGVRNGSRIRVASEGGNIYLTVNVMAHRLFERKNDDLHIELPIAVPEAALGAEIEVPTLKGKVSMKIPPETSSGKTFRLPGYGMPRLKAGGTGDQYVKVKVVVPLNLTDREKKLFEELKLSRKENPRAYLSQ